MDATGQIPGARLRAQGSQAQNYSTGLGNRPWKMWDMKAEIALLPATCEGMQMGPTGALQSIEVPGDLSEIADIARRFGRV
jgi:hypothetical protein